MELLENQGQLVKCLEQEVGQRWKERERHELVRMERSEGVIDAVVNGKVTGVFQEDTWIEDEKVMTGLVDNLGGTYF